MPYRRLPNTDQARLRALETARKKAIGLSPFDIPFSQKWFLELKTFLPQFQQAVDQYNGSKNRQSQVGKVLSEQFKMARLYVSHYIQVFNFCVQRNELNSSVRKYLGLSDDDKSVPELGTEQQLITWGDRVIKGEEQRMLLGGTRIYNPSIAVVRVKYEQFLESYNSHKSLLVTTQKLHEKVVAMREHADLLIVNVWNEIEEKYKDLAADTKREKCADFGIVYFQRRHEKEESQSNHELRQ
jgi:hypothetical protein